MSILPITPEEVIERKQKEIPDDVFEVFNALIAKKFDGNSSHIKQKHVVEMLVDRGYKSTTIFDEHWLDVEDIYRKAGWEVKYDKPAYNENYDAYFVFSKPRKC